MKKEFLIGIVLLASTLAHATITNGVVTIDVPEGTVTLTEEQIAEILSPECTTLVKRGAGTLRHTDQALATFSGAIRVEEGVLRVWKKGDLGTEAGATYVSAGATLLWTPYQEVVPTASDVSFQNEEIHLAGAGSGDHPYALLFSYNGKSSYANLKNLHLDADTTIHTENRFDINNVRFNGHTLTKAGGGSPLAFGSNVQTPGHLIIERGGMQVDNGFETWTGDAQNTITIKSGARFHRWNSSFSAKWSLIFEENSIHEINTCATPDKGRYSGPIILNGTPVLCSVNKGGGYMTFLNTVSGPGAIRTVKSGTGSSLILSLYGAGTYTGGTRLEYDTTLRTFATNAISLSGPLVATNSTIDASGAGYQALSIPKASFHITAEMTQPQILALEMQTHGGLSKTGDGTLRLPYTTFNGPLEVLGGRLELAALPAGWEEAYGENLPFGKIEDHPRQGASLSPRLATDRAGGISWPVDTIFSAVYTGYIWNRTGTNAVWRFAESIDENAKIFLDGKEIMNDFDFKTVNIVSTEIAPGPHLLVLYAYNKYGAGGTSPWNEKSGYGFAYDPTNGSGTNVTDFLSLIDPGDGSLITRSQVPETASTRIPSLSLRNNATLDLEGAGYAIPTVTLGSGTIENGAITITEHLTIQANDTGVILTDGALSFPENVTYAVSNPDTLDKNTIYPICTATAIHGTPSALSDQEKWRLRLRNKGKTLELYHSNGTILFVR